MHYNVILVSLCIFIVWLIAVNILRCILEWIEGRSDTYCQTMVVKILGYDSESHPPAIIATTEEFKRLRLYDYRHKFEGVGRTYIDQWVRVEMANHYSGFILIRITKQVYSIKRISYMEPRNNV